MNYSIWLPLNSLLIIDWQKKKQKVEDILFWKTPGVFYFVTLPLEIPDKTKLHPWKFHKTALDPLEIPRPNHQDPWKLHIIFFLFTLGNSLCYFFNTSGDSLSSPRPPTPLGFLLE